MEFMHIHNALDSHIAEKMSEALELLTDEYEIEWGHYAPVEHESYSGFIPFTNGGWELTYPVQLSDIEDHMREFTTVDERNNPESYGKDKKKTLNTQLEDVIDYCYMVALETFIDHHREELEGLFPAYDLDDLAAVKAVINYHDLYKINRGELAETLSEYERDNLDTEPLYLQLRAFYFDADNARNVTGTDEVYFFAGVNTDYGYGRDNYLDLTFEVTVPLKELSFEKVNDIINEMLESINVTESV